MSANRGLGHALSIVSKSVELFDALLERLRERYGEELAAIAREAIVIDALGLADIKIRTKKRKLVPFDPNEIQVGYLDDILPQWRDGDLRMRGLREIILKARQFGFSTLIAVLFFIDTIETPNTGTVVIADKTKTSKKLFEMVSRMYWALPEERRPEIKRANVNELFWPGIDSHYEIMTAGTETSGRGWTVNNLHCSEVAFWKNSEMLGGLLQAVPEEGNVFLESTANGEGSASITEEGEKVITGSAFHVYYEEGKDPDNPFTSRFFPWHANPAYRKTAPEDFTRVSQADEGSILFARYSDEERLAELYGLDNDQLYWRRQKIDEPNMGPAKFCQEYPANDVEAFRTSGKKFFAGLWDKDVHVQELEIKPWWTPIGGFDWGFGVPYSFGLGWIFPLRNGRVGFYISDELYGTRVRNTDQAAAILELLKKRAIRPEDIEIFADPSMWAKKGRNQSDNIGRADVEDYHDAGLRFIEANNNRVHGCSNMREYMAAKGALYVDPSCEHLINQLSTVLHDPHDVEVYEQSKTSEQHSVDMARYLLNTRPWAPEEPGTEMVTLHNGIPIKPLRELPAELQTEDISESYY